MREENRATLEKAIRSLPSYSPPEESWEAIESALVQQQQDDQLNASIADLPEYQAPVAIWDQIETELDSPKPALKVVSNRKWRPWAAAASIALLLGFGLWQGWFSGNDNTEFLYSQIDVEQFEYANDWDRDETTFKAVFASFKDSPMAKGDAHYEELIENYKELDAAKEALQLLIESYGKDPDVIKEISSLERERSKVIKAMAALI